MEKIAGKVYEDIYLKFLNDARERGTFTLDDIVHLIGLLRKYENDAHIVIAGQNGVGKSYLLLMLLKKCLKKDIMSSLMLARHTTDDVVNFILTHEGTVMGIDELNQYFYYTDFMTSEQKHLISMIELARSKCIGFIGCVRDPRKLTKNYRDGKMSVVIWIIDRYSDGGSYAGVFVANPMIEGAERFGFDFINPDMADFDTLRDSFDYVPSFCGWLDIPDARKILTKNEIAVYKKEKKDALAYAHIKRLTARLKKKQISQKEYNQHLQILGKAVPENSMQQYLG